MLTGLVSGVMVNKSVAKLFVDELNHKTIRICNENMKTGQGVN